MRAAVSKVLETFGEMPVYDGFWSEGKLTVFIIGFEQVADIEANPLANALGNDNLKFSFYGDEFQRVGLLESITVGLIGWVRDQRRTNSLQGQKIPQEFDTRVRSVLLRPGPFRKTELLRNLKY